MCHQNYLCVLPSHVNNGTVVPGHVPAASCMAGNLRNYMVGKVNGNPPVAGCHYLHLIGSHVNPFLQKPFPDYHGGLFAAPSGGQHKHKLFIPADCRLRGCRANIYSYIIHISSPLETNSPFLRQLCCSNLHSLPVQNRES